MKHFCLLLSVLKAVVVLNAFVKTAMHFIQDSFIIIINS